MNEFFQNPRIMKSFVALLFSASLALVAVAITTIKEFAYVGRDIPPMSTIMVSGEGETFAIPDIAEFSFSVVKEAKTVPEAQQQSADLNNAILAYLKESGVDEKDVKTTNYSVNPRYEYQKTTQQVMCIKAPCPPIVEGKQVLVGYEVNQTVSVKVRKVDEAGKILGGVGEKGATNISGIQFTVDEPEKKQDEARQKAIADAKEKAKVLSKDLGVHLARVVSFSENSGGYPMPTYAQSAFGKGGDMMEAASPNIPVGENKIVSNVSIVYEIR